MVTQVTIEVTDQNPSMFQLDWLNACHDNVDFGVSHTENFLAEVNRTLAHRVRGEFNNQWKQQALFELLGQDYVQLHFPHHQFSPELLRPPNLPAAKREECLAEMRDLLEDQLGASLEELGYPPDIATYQEDTPLKGFLDEIRLIFKGGCEEQVQRRCMSENDNRRQSVDSRISTNSVNDDEDGEKFSKVEFKKSDVLGDALVDLLQYDGGARVNVINNFKLESLMFPNPLRKIIWEGVLADNDQKEKGKKKSKRREARDFKAEIKKKLKGGIERAVQSSDYKKIHSAVIDTYLNNCILKTFAEDSNMLQTAHIINIINVFNKSYSNAMIYWVLPFQIIYETGDESRRKEEKYMIEISCMLEKFSRHCPLSWTDVGNVADDVVHKVKGQDPAFIEHLRTSLDTGIHASGMLHYFVPEILHPTNSSKGEKLWNNLYKKKKKDWKPQDHELFANVELFIRKWVSEAFVGVLNKPNILFIWDLLFMNNWSKKLFLKICVVILGLIQPWLRAATTHAEVVLALLEEPAKLYLQDIRSGLQDINNREDIPFEKISILNKNYMVIEKKEEPKPVEEEKNVENEDEDENKLPTVDEDNDEQGNEDENENKEETTADGDANEEDKEITNDEEVKELEEQEEAKE